MLADAGVAGDGRRKKTCSEQPPAVDLLSALPDSLLLHILSFLSMEDVVSTALLSRRWRQLWTSTPCLDFYCGYGRREAWGSYAPPDFIVRALAIHEGTKIRTFRAAVRVPSEEKEYENDDLIDMVDFWVWFAVECRVEDMELEFVEIEDGDYLLPDCVFTCESLVSLSLQFCEIALPPRIRMSSLRSLTLYCVSIRDGDLKDLLAGCPSLECLTLQNFNPSFYHGICAERLKTLSLCDDFEPRYYPTDYMVHISAPSLTTLVLTGFLRTYDAMKGLSSIVTVSLDFGCMYFWVTDFDDYECLADLLIGLRHVQVLRLCSWCTQALSIRASEGSQLSSEFSIVKLELAVSLNTCEFPGIFSALRSFKKLKFLTIDTMCSTWRIALAEDTSEYHVMSNERSSPTMLQNLKTVCIFDLDKAICAEESKDKTVDEILELEKFRNGFEFLQFLLENAPVLERLTINATANVNKLTEKNLEILSRFASRVLALPRASPNALVIMQEL